MKGDLDTEKVGITAVQPHPKNVRQGDIGAICESLEAHGQYRAIVAQRSTGHILAGNHTWKAAKQLGWSHITTHYIDCDDDGAMRILLADNRANDLASYDDAALIAVLQELAATDDGLAGTLFDGDALDQLIGDIGTDIHQDEIPTSAPAITQLGDIWLLGNHRVMCGDATNPEMMTSLISGQLADIVFTDPPYGVSYEGGVESQRRKLQGDDDTRIIMEACRLAFDYSTNSAPLYLWHADKFVANCTEAAIQTGYELRALIIWVKQMAQYGALTAHYKKQHESCLYCVKKGGSASWSGSTTEVTVWQEDRASVNEFHPTQKPVNLAVRAIRNHNGKLVLDPFGGSGSTLIAAHQTGRTCYTMELDPHYCDIICARYQKQTGDKPRLEATGDEHNFLP